MEAQKKTQLVHELSFEETGLRLGRSAEAARKLLARAVAQLSVDDNPDEEFVAFLAAHAEALGDSFPAETPVTDDPALRLRPDAARPANGP